MGQNSHCGKSMFQRLFVCDGIDAKGKAADDHHIIRSQLLDQFFRDLFSIFCISPGPTMEMQRIGLRPASFIK